MRITINQLRRIIREEVTKTDPITNRMKNMILPKQIADLSKVIKDPDQKNLLNAVRSYMIKGTEPDPQMMMDFQDFVDKNKNFKAIVKDIMKYYKGFSEAFGIDPDGL